MNTDRIARVAAAMRENGVDQLLASDAVVIRYLTGASLHSGERLIALLIGADGRCKLVLNDLFVNQKPDVDTVFYNDTDDCIAMLLGEMPDGITLAVDKNWPARFLLDLQQKAPGIRCVNSSFIIDNVRIVKDAEEQAKMIRSSELNDEVMARFIPQIRKGMSESDLAEIVTELYAEVGCEGMSFPPICSFAKNAADPHHGPDETLGQYGDCLVIDIGGMKDEYASDMTRTVFLGTVSERQREIYEIVKEANRRGREAAKPGNRMCDVDLAARSYIESKGLGKYFTHRTGHSIGLEDHEWGDVSSVNTAVIRPGQCFSVEPGIYIPEEGIGVRIEDLVLITADGCRVLNAYPRELTVVPFD